MESTFLVVSKQSVKRDLSGCQENLIVRVRNKYGPALGESNHYTARGGFTRPLNPFALGKSVLRPHTGFRLHYAAEVAAGVAVSEHELFRRGQQAGKLQDYCNPCHVSLVRHEDGKCG